ncbi:hypothetical protein EGW08_006273 [Elysia chlorotica]|uniref:Transmembrane protein 138 n=1 Tax=Elysia chlorotica TaxID=188477 RepID=A0A3S1BDN2_ELYCH|nr:hypothetical protein EGW08_006273 [Elysia chlorotica]
MMLVSRYRPVLLLQYLLIIVDLFMNSFTELLRFQNVILLVLYVIQDFCLVFAVIIIFLLFFSTFIFQAGLVSILVSKFKVAISVTFIYFGLCVALHVWTMRLRWDNVDRYIWDNTGYHILYACQRIAAVLYYYFYKRTALKLGEPHFYTDSEWIQKEFERRR